MAHPADIALKSFAGLMLEIRHSDRRTRLKANRNKYSRAKTRRITVVTSENQRLPNGLFKLYIMNNVSGQRILVPSKISSGGPA